MISHHQLIQTHKTFPAGDGRTAHWRQSFSAWKVLYCLPDFCDQQEQYLYLSVLKRKAVFYRKGKWHFILTKSLWKRLTSTSFKGSDTIAFFYLLLHEPSLSKSAFCIRPAEKAVRKFNASLHLENSLPLESSEAMVTAEGRRCF